MKEVLLLLEYATDCGAVAMQKARNAEKELYWLTGLYFALQLGMAAKSVDIVKTE